MNFQRAWPLRFILAALFPAVVLSAPIESVPFDYIPLRRQGEPTLFEVLGPDSTRVNYKHEVEFSWHPQKRLYYSSFACGALATGDVDLDGLIDIYVTGGAGPNKLYVNAGNMSFVDVTAGVPITIGASDGEIDLWGSGSAMIDIDNDGDLDIYACFYDEPNQLYVNQLIQRNEEGELVKGELRFIEMAADYGLDIADASLVPSFADFDNDGDLDLYLLTNRLYHEGGRPINPFEPDPRNSEKSRMKPEIARHFKLVSGSDKRRVYLEEIGRRDYLLRNDNGLTPEGEPKKFVDVTSKAGMSTGPAVGNSATWWDFNGDGLSDLHVGNDGDDPDYLYQNLGNGKFREVLAGVFPHSTRNSRGTVVTDANLDGNLDFFAADRLPKTHLGQMTATIPKEIDADEGVAQQLFRNSLFVNSGVGRFYETGYLAGISKTDWTWAVKSGDYDQDGRQDLFFCTGASRTFDHADQPELSHKALVGKTHWDLFEETEPLRQQNFAYRNASDLRYHNVSKAWGLNHVGMTYHASQADLDNDGDLDLVTASLDEHIYIYRNDQVGIDGKPLKRWTIRVKLRGTQSNRQGIGAVVTVRTEKGEQVRQVQASGGFMDADETSAHFGLGSESTVKQLIVKWPSGVVQEFQNLEGNHLHTITEDGTSGIRPSPIDPTPWFALNTSIAKHKQTESSYNDFEKQPLLPYKLSQQGPSQAWGDLDGDGKEDLLIGGSAGKPAQLVYNKSSKGSSSLKFEDWIQKALINNKASEDMGAVFLDVEGDGDLDIYVSSGGVEHQVGDTAMRDHLYENNGWGKLTDKTTERLPNIRESSSVVSAVDYDRDGDMDLFVGSRSIPGEYPLPASGHLLLNEEGVFRDVTEELAPSLLNSGLITSAVWTDVDNDAAIDLVVAYEWGAVTVYRNRENQLVPYPSGTNTTLGWWNAVASADLDNDGDMDLVATNMGTNSQFRASERSPELIFYGDVSGGGAKNILQAYYEGTVSYPRHGLEQTSKAMPSLKEKVKTHQEYASRNLTEIFDLAQLKTSTIVKATELRSGAFYNDGTGNFSFVPFPEVAQLAPSYGVALRDFDLDGYVDCYLVQNLKTTHPATGALMGGMSQLLRRNPEATKPEEYFDPIVPKESGLIVTGDAKSLTVIDLNHDFVPDLVVGVNSEGPQIFLNKIGKTNRALPIVLRGVDGNKSAVGSRVEVEVPEMPVQVLEVQNGGGFLSASTARIVVAKPEGFAGEVKVTVCWPDGEVSADAYPIDEDGRIVIEEPVPLPPVEVVEGEAGEEGATAEESGDSE